MSEKRQSVGFMSHKSVKGYEIYEMSVNFDKIPAESLIKDIHGDRMLKLICFFDENKKASSIALDENKITYYKEREANGKLEI